MQKHFNCFGNFGEFWRQLMSYEYFFAALHWPSSMFYTQQLLARKGPLGLWWLLGNGRPLSGVQCRCSTAEL